MKALFVVALLAAVTLAGCNDGKDRPAPGEDPPLKSGKGAISGLVINDVYRPVPGALVLVQPAGLTVTSDASGQFSVPDLEPGAYVLRVQADGHEAAPQSVDVVAGEYAEAELLARRIANEGSRIVTTEYSVFIPCAVDFVASGYVVDCTLDQSGDSFRAGFLSNYTGYQNVTYLVTEMKANKADRYEVQVRCEDIDRDGDGEAEGEYYAVSRIDGDYSKMVLRLGEPSLDAPVPPEYDEPNPWLNDCEINTILFSDSAGREEIQSVDPTGLICCGAGAHFGIRARFVQSLFLGEPEVDVATYSVLG